MSDIQIELRVRVYDEASARELSIASSIFQ